MKTRSSFVCKDCGYETSQWYGKCPNCGNWNTLVETSRIIGKPKTASVFSKTTSSIQKLTQIRKINTQRVTTKFTELDRILGGGLVPGAVVLVAGEPGIGKSTLILQVLGKVGGWYVTGEESAEQVKLRADRLKIANSELVVLSENHLESVFDLIEKTDKLPQMLVVDSIQTLYTDSVEGGAGQVSQVRQVCQLLISFAKTKHLPVVIVGHVTKEGEIAGPKLLEHMVDVVCYFEGDRYSQARLLRSYKNRFGPTDEVGIFEMDESGLVEVTNPSKLFLEGRSKGVAGSAIAIVMEGTRPLLVEVQSLVVASQLAMPRRVANGFDYNRLQVILAILQKRLNLPLGGFDVFINISGGIKISEPACDLPVALSLISAVKNIPLVQDLAAFGELGLMGEIRRVSGEQIRAKEARRLGFNHIISPEKFKTINQVATSYFKNKS